MLTTTTAHNSTLLLYRSNFFCCVLLLLLYVLAAAAGAQNRNGHFLQKEANRNADDEDSFANDHATYRHRDTQPPTTMARVLLDWVAQAGSEDEEESRHTISVACDHVPFETRDSPRF